ncbi:MAG: nuclear transport factor 2 family protein [Chitinophagaceae bacterium]|nr:MAG: nuclear transport factor 2 family protein [Chitinophagaceae bacterium]
MKTKELLEVYYHGLAQKNGWESVLSDDFKFIGGDMTQREPVRGKKAYIEILQRFGRLFNTMRVKEMFIRDNDAFVLANYDYVFPGGKAVNGDVAELWKVKDGKLDELTIYFDTLSFEKLLHSEIK